MTLRNQDRLLSVIFIIVNLIAFVYIVTRLTFGG